MASTLALMALPSFFNQVGLGGDDGGGGGGGGGYSDAPPDYQQSLDAVQRQRDEDQRALNQLGEAVKKQNENLEKRITKTQETAVAQLNKQQEEFKKKTVDVRSIKMPGIDPNVLLYGGVAFGIMALFIVMKK
jgi:hypothetical protein